MDQTSRAGAGRPRDPLLEQRVQDAACRLYGVAGWAGFSIDAVAREARVGKSSIYLRWPNNTALLLDSLQARIDVPYDVDTGTVRGDLFVLARSILSLLTGEAGDADALEEEGLVDVGVGHEVAEGEADGDHGAASVIRVK